MRSLCVGLVTCLALFGAVSAMSAQDVTPVVPEPQAVPTPLPTIPSDLDPPPATTTPAVSPVPTRTPTKVLAAAVATPGPDMTVSASRPRKKEAAASSKSRKTAEPPAPREAETAAGSAVAAPVIAGPGGGEPPQPPGAEPPKPADADALAPLSPPPEAEAVTPAAVVKRSSGPISPWVLFGGLFFGAAAVTVTFVTRRKPDLVLHITH